jgi:hypothetical protein
MGASHIWYAVVRDVAYTSAGASGAVCGLIGVAWIGATRFVPRQSGIADGMKRWAFMLAVWGFVVPGINNAAHLGGFVGGCALGRLVLLSPPKSVSMQRALSAITGAATLGVLACGVIAVVAAAPFPWSLDDDVRGASLVGINVSGDKPAWRDSTQYDALMACDRVVVAGRPIADVISACEFALRAAPYQPVPAYDYLAHIERDAGNLRRAGRLVHAREVVRSLLIVE